MRGYIVTKRFLLLNHFTLYYFQELVDQFNVYYDRDRFKRVYQNLSRYCLFQYRKLYPADKNNNEHGSFEIDKNPAHLRVAKYMFVFICLRAYINVFVKSITATKLGRVWTGTEFLKKDSVYIETCVLFWSCISVLFFQFTTTKSLLDYKFLAIFRMSDNNSNYVHPSQFGFNEDEFRRFKNFRKGALFYYNCLMGSLPPFASVVIVGMHFRANLFHDYPAINIPWIIIVLYWVYMVCAVVYSNLVAFIVVSKYIHIKQKSIATAIKRCLTHMRWNRIKLKTYDQILWRKFIEQNTRYSHLQDELEDYDRFWTSYLSFVFVFYVLLISFIIFVCIFGQAEILMNAVFGLILNFHVALLGTIIYYCGGIVLRNTKLSADFIGLVAQMGQTPWDSYGRLSALQVIKMHNMSQYLTQMCFSGFRLLNGYLITHDTFRVLIANIAVYFLLIIKK